MSEKHQECSECGKPLAHRIHSPTYGTHAYREPVAFPQATRQCADNDPTRYCRCGGERGNPSCMFPDAAQPAAGTTPQAERPKFDDLCDRCITATHCIVNGCCLAEARAVAPVETPDDAATWAGIDKIPTGRESAESEQNKAGLGYEAPSLRNEPVGVQTRLTAEQFQTEANDLLRRLSREVFEDGINIEQLPHAVDLVLSFAEEAFKKGAEAFRDKSEAELREEIERPRAMADSEFTLRAKLAEQERLLHAIVLMVCDPKEAARGGDLPTPAKAVEQIIDRVIAAEAEAAALRERERCQSCDKLATDHYCDFGLRNEFFTRTEQNEK